MGYVKKQAVCRVIRSTQTMEGKQATRYSIAVSAESVGAKGLCVHTITIPPGAKAKAHLHENHETSIYVLSGHAGMWYGERLEHHLEAQSGDFIFIPAGVPHLPYNLSPTDPAIGIAARTDPNEQESVVLLPELDGLR